MNIVDIAQITGIISFASLLALGYYLMFDNANWKKSGKIAFFWVINFLSFLLMLRILSAFSLGTQDQLRIIAGFSSLIPLVAVLTQLFLTKKMDEEGERRVMEMADEKTRAEKLREKAKTQTLTEPEKAELQKLETEETQPQQ
jgi:hypothetical protein